MKKEQPKLQVIVHGELDLRKLPKDVLDAFIATLTEEISKLMEEDSAKNKNE